MVFHRQASRRSDVHRVVLCWAPFMVFCRDGAHWDCLALSCWLVYRRVIVVMQAITVGSNEEEEEATFYSVLAFN